MTARHLLRRVAPAVVVTALLAGCASIPDSGPVKQGEGVRTEREDPFIRVIARPPRPGMTPEEVVQGFLQASASFDDDHAVAREYLTAAAAAAWAPGARTVEYQGVPTTSEVAGGIVAAVRQVGTISARGELTTTRPAVRQFTFALEQAGGQWRISRPPEGLLLSDLDVARAYRPFNLYFPEPEARTLVPNPVLLPVGPGVSTALVRALLDGPTPWLAPAVRTAFPTGTRLVVDSAPLRDGVVQVDLTEQVATADDAGRRSLSAQLVWTLAQLPEVLAVRVTVDGQPLAVPGQGAVQSVDAWPEYDPDGIEPGASAYFVREGEVLRLDDGRASAVPGPAGDGALSSRSVAVSTDGGTGAVVSGSGQVLSVVSLRQGSQAQAVLSGADLGPPGYDVTGVAWLVDRTGDGPVLWAVPPQGVAVRVALPGLAGRPLLDVRVARDGARAAVVLGGPSGGLYLARVVRAKDGIRIDGLRPVPSPLTDLTRVAWSDASRLLVLGRQPGGPVQPTLLSLSTGDARGLGQLDNVVTALAAAPGSPPLVATSDGTLWLSGGVGWSTLGRGVGPAYPG